MQTKIDAAVALLDRADVEHSSAGVWSLFSGGDDSLACVVVASQSKGFRGCVHLDTGTGIPETRQFVEETCRRQGWPLKVYTAKACGQNYDDLAIAYGFPGPAMHYKMYSRLKERPLRVFIREHKRHLHDRLVLATGARSQESTRRMGHVQPCRQEGVKVWANPLHDWSKHDCHVVIEAAGTPRNPVVELLHMSGECLCGAFAAPGELKEIGLWFPRVAARIHRLERRVARAGQTACIWGVRPPASKRHSIKLRDSAGRISELCRRCELKDGDVESR